MTSAQSARSRGPARWIRARRTVGARTDLPLLTVDDVPCPADLPVGPWDRRSGRAVAVSR